MEPADSSSSSPSSEMLRSSEHPQVCISAFLLHRKFINQTSNLNQKYVVKSAKLPINYMGRANVIFPIFC